MSKEQANKDFSAEKSTYNDGELAEELKLQSEIEASEQKPLNDNVVEKLMAELADMKDQHVRLYAEFDNYKKRTLKERTDLMKSAGSDVILSLLPVLDDFERALKASADMDEKHPQREGMILVYHKLKSILTQKGLKPMDAIGSPFDVDLHDAITNMQVDKPEMKGKVIDEVEKGYWLGDKVLRHAKVVVGS